MSTSAALKSVHKIKEPKNLSKRITWLRDYYYKGVDRPWNNEFTAWTTGTPWDVQFDEMTFYIVPETYPFMQTFRSCMQQAARPVKLHPDFWKWSLVERKAWFVREVMVNYVPAEILPGDLIAGGRFNLQTSKCWTKQEAKLRDRLIYGKKGARASMKWFHDHGYGNSGATSGHLIPGYERALKIGWRGIYEDLDNRYSMLPQKDKKGKKGAQLSAMMTAATTARDLAAKYAALCERMALDEKEAVRQGRVAAEWQPSSSASPGSRRVTFWEAVQALWITHMLVMSDENYPGPGRFLRPYRPVSAALLAAVHCRRHGEGTGQGDHEMPLGACQHGVRRHDPRG